MEIKIIREIDELGRIVIPRDARRERMSETALISSEGAVLLADRVMHEALSAIASAVGVSAEEYLERFEAVLLERPEEIFNAFGECK